MISDVFLLYTWYVRILPEKQDQKNRHACMSAHSQMSTWAHMCGKGGESTAMVLPGQASRLDIGKISL